MPIPKRLVQRVLERDGGMCVLSSRFCLGEATVADHRVNRGMGGLKGLDRVELLVSACSVCNGLKESDPEFAAVCRERGLKISPSQSSAQDARIAALTPVEYPDGVLYWLTADGRKVEAGLEPKF